jgi:hypothetical protein
VGREQFVCAGHVMLLAGAQTKLHRLASSVYGNVELGAESAARAAERLVARGLFSGAPAAC